MSGSFFSSTQFPQTSIVQSTLRISRSQPDPDSKLNADMDLTISTDRASRGDDGVWDKNLTLVVNISVGSGGQEEFMHVMLELDGGARSPELDGLGETDMDRFLAANAVSALYAAARSHIEMLTSMTPMQRFTLPAIDPYAVVDGV